MYIYYRAKRKPRSYTIITKNYYNLQSAISDKLSLYRGRLQIYYIKG
jgi:hypothetical protein